ncbi:MAG TPA: hypothetical protein VLG14_01190 [Sphingomonas sp.]|nr:hypothetical protein [Sphingomonas sp.]
MTDKPGAPRLADLPREERERLEVENQREIQDGLTRRHVSIAADQQRYLAVQLARVAAMGKREG